MTDMMTMHQESAIYEATLAVPKPRFMALKAAATYLFVVACTVPLTLTVLRQLEDPPLEHATIGWEAPDFSLQDVEVTNSRSPSLPKLAPPPRRIVKRQCVTRRTELHQPGGQVKICDRVDRAPTYAKETLTLNF